MCDVICSLIAVSDLVIYRRCQQISVITKMLGDLIKRSNRMIKLRDLQICSLNQIKVDLSDI